MAPGRDVHSAEELLEAGGEFVDSLADLRGSEEQNGLDFLRVGDSSCESVFGGVAIPESDVDGVDESHVVPGWSGYGVEEGDHVARSERIEPRSANLFDEFANGSVFEGGVFGVEVAAGDGQSAREGGKRATALDDGNDRRVGGRENHGQGENTEAELGGGGGRLLVCGKGDDIAKVAFLDAQSPIGRKRDLDAFSLIEGDRFGSLVQLFILTFLGEADVRHRKAGGGAHFFSPK